GGHRRAERLEAFPQAARQREGSKPAARLGNISCESRLACSPERSWTWRSGPHCVVRSAATKPVNSGAEENGSHSHCGGAAMISLANIHETAATSPPLEPAHSPLGAVS